MAETWRTFDHTGDLGLEVEADSAERLHALAAIALLAQQVEPAAGAHSEVEVRLALEGDDAADLFVHWLNSALLHATLEGATWTRAEVALGEGPRLEGRLAGPRVDPARDVLLREIKAVSHHDLALDLTPGACRARLVLDL